MPAPLIASVLNRLYSFMPQMVLDVYKSEWQGFVWKKNNNNKKKTQKNITDNSVLWTESGLSNSKITTDIWILLLK